MKEMSRDIQSISFRDGAIEIQYADSHDLSENVALLKIVVFNEKLLEQEAEEILSDIDDLIDLAIDKLRNPPMTRPSALR